MKRLWRSQKGFTLPEAVLAVGLFTFIMSGVATGIFRVQDAENRVSGGAVAIKDLRKMAGWFSLDAIRAVTTDLVDGAPPASSVTMTWTDQFGGTGTTHTASYSLTGNRLYRTFDGQAQFMADDIVSVAFSRSGKTLTAQFVVNAERGTTRSVSIQAYMRAAP
jgi:type II secretory pathway pseudopilin PulG